MIECIIMASTSEQILTLLVAVRQRADKRVTYNFVAIKIGYISDAETLRRM